MATISVRTLVKLTTWVISGSRVIENFTLYLVNKLAVDAFHEFNEALLHQYVCYLY